MADKKTKKPAKKTVVKKTVAKKSKVTLDNFPFEELLKICKKDTVIADKIQQLISDYAFEKDQTERERCICIAFGNWALDLLESLLLIFTSSIWGVHLSLDVLH